jgi:hypothetical protein
MVVVLAVAQWRAIDRLRGLPMGMRGEAYARAMLDIERVCNPPPTEEAPLGEHCRQQAQFVVVFPECASECRRLVDGLLPRARR